MQSMDSVASAGILMLTIHMVLWNTSSGAFLTPNAHTLSGVMAVNGSNANGDCPTECVVLAADINTCDCVVSTIADEAITASVLIDGVVPTIDTSERNSADEFVWAAPLFTVRASTGSVTLGFRFQTGVVLCEVELYVFNCPAWGIGAEDIFIHNGVSFPTFSKIFTSRGRVFLTSDMQDCTSLTRVSIPLQMARSTTSYFIEINSVSGTIEWVHIAEVRFSDQCDSTTMEPTDPTTQPIEEPTTTLVTTEMPTEMPTEMMPAEEVATTSETTTPSDISPSNSTLPPVSSGSSTPPSTLIPSASIMLPVIPSSSSSLLPSETPTMATPLPPVTTSSMSTMQPAASPEPTTGTTSQTSSEIGSADHTTPPLTTSDAVTSAPTTSSSFPVTVVGALVGVVVVLLILILIGCVVVVAFFLRRKKIQRIKEKLIAGVPQTGADGTELNSRDSMMRNYHYQEAHQILNETGQHPPPLPPVPPGRWGGVTPSGSSTFHPITPQKGAVMMLGKPSISIDGLTGITTEIDGGTLPAYDTMTQPIDSQYSTIDNCILEKDEALLQLQGQGSSDNPSSTTAKAARGKKGGGGGRKRTYSMVRKKNPPVVPSKSTELCLELQAATLPGMHGKGDVSEEEYYSKVQEVKLQMQDIPKVNLLLAEDEGINPAYVSSENLFAPQQRREDLTYCAIDDNAMSRLAAKRPMFLGSYSEIQRGCGASDDEDEVYTVMKGNVLAKRHVTSGPVVLTASTICKGLEVNPEYESADTLMKAMDNVQSKTLDSAKAALRIQNGSENVYETVHTERIKPSMFMKSTRATSGDGDGETLSTTTDTTSGTTTSTSTDTTTGTSTSTTGTGEHEDPEQHEMIYGPIYSPISSLDPGKFRRVLEFTADNVRKIRTLGTGFFGKVVLADTVGVSMKDLGLSDADDDKAMSKRVAVKQLRQNPAPDRREAFYKELKFMSQLDHPNVIRTLGACTVDTPFIVMEYMEKGDLNQYLQDFDGITPGSAPPTDLAISVGTLVSMSAQIADAMKYLASRNYIHRDLATRNCLVGPDSRIKIADFGMSKNLYRSHYYFMSAHAILPIRWMAKECFYGKFSAKTDVWAFGVTIWEVFTLGKDIPYEDMDDSEIVADASDEGNRQLLKKPKDCPDDVYAVMMLCWEEEPKDRATFERLHETLSSLRNT